MQLAGIVGKNWRRRWTSRTQAGRVGHWYAGLVLLNNHPSQHIRQSAPMPLPLISSRLLKQRTTISSNARFVCRAEFFCSICQTRVFPIIQWRGDFNCSAKDETSDNIHVEFLKNLGPKAHTWLTNSSPESWLHIPSWRSGERPRW